MINKTLKKDFSKFDASICTMAFIVFSLTVQLLLLVVPTNNLFMAILMSALIEAVFFFAAMFTAGVKKVEFIEATKLNKKISPAMAALAIALSLVCLFGYTNLTNVFVVSLENLGYTPRVSNVAIPNFGVYLIYVVLLCVCPAIFEETCFRGCILSSLKNYNKHAAVVLSALVFMLMHGGPDQTIHQFIVGIICGYAFVYSSSLWVPIIVHFVNNFVAITVLFAYGGGAEEEVFTFVPWSEVAKTLIVALVVGAIATYIVYLILKTLKNERRKFEAKNMSKEERAEVVKQDEELFQSDETPASEAQKDEEKRETIMPQKKKINLEGALNITLWILGGAYLVIEWITTLISGFGVGN